MEQIMNKPITSAEAEVLIEFATQHCNAGSSDIKCPRCGGLIELEKIGSGYEVLCSNGCGIKITGRGI